MRTLGREKELFSLFRVPALRSVLEGIEDLGQREVSQIEWLPGLEHFVIIGFSREQPLPRDFDRLRVELYISSIAGKSSGPLGRLSHSRPV
jgi:hypothetical protein